MPRTCHRPNCFTDAYARGLCRAHYLVQLRHGTFICAGALCTNPVDVRQLVCDDCRHELRQRVAEAGIR
jgi:hypothetical protein